MGRAQMAPGRGATPALASSASAERGDRSPQPRPALASGRGAEVGCCYLAVAQSSVEEPKHTEKILQLALGLEDLIRQANTERDARQPLLCRTCAGGGNPLSLGAAERHKGWELDLRRVRGSSSWGSL